MIPLRTRLGFAALIATLLIGGPLWYRARTNRLYRNFRIVEPGVLYRSAQMPLEGFQRLFHDHRFRAVVSLRTGDAASDKAEEAFCHENGIRFVRLPPRAWGAINGIVPADENLEQFLKVMDEPANYPVLLHCFAGTHRTGAYVAVYRMEYEGWSNERALRELRTNGYVTLDGDLDVLDFLTYYQPRAKKDAHRGGLQEKGP